MHKMGELIPKLKERKIKHRTDLIDVSGIKLPTMMMPGPAKKPKAIKIRR